MPLSVMPPLAAVAYTLVEPPLIDKPCPPVPVMLMALAVVLPV